MYVSAPVKETPTIYEAFLEKEQKEQKVSKSAKDQGKATANGDAGKKQTQPRKKQGGEKKKESPLSLDEALKRVRYLTTDQRHLNFSWFDKIEKIP